MCLAILHIDPEDAWPVLFAFIRDEDRERPSDPPARWWAESPNLFGGRDQRGGGTWLAVDTHNGRLAAVLNRLDVPPPPAYPYAVKSRGELPLLALKTLAGGEEFDAHSLTDYAPYLLIIADKTGEAESWEWDGENIYQHPLGTGIHTINRMGVDKHDISIRQANAIKAFRNRPSLDLNSDPIHAWGDWIHLLDGREVRHGGDQGIVVAGVDLHPTFGTVGGSLVGLSNDGEIRFDINSEYDLHPERWQEIDLVTD